MLSPWEGRGSPARRRGGGVDTGAPVDGQSVCHVHPQDKPVPRVLRVCRVSQIPTLEGRDAGQAANHDRVSLPPDILCRTCAATHDPAHLLNSARETNSTTTSISRLRRAAMRASALPGTDGLLEPAAGSLSVFSNRARKEPRENLKEIGEHTSRCIGTARGGEKKGMVSSREPAPVHGVERERVLDVEVQGGPPLGNRAVHVALPVQILLEPKRVAQGRLRGRKQPPVGPLQK